MKKASLLLLTLILAMSFTACGESTHETKNPELKPTETKATETKASDAPETDVPETDAPETDAPETDAPETEAPETKAVLSSEEVESWIAVSTADIIQQLESKMEELSEPIDSYGAYFSNKEKVYAFYEEIFDMTENLCLTLYDYALVYANVVMESDASNDDKYDEFENIYACIYEDACDDIYDDIYDGVLDDLYDAFYKGVLDERDDTVEYDEWYDIRSEEYDIWSDTRSDIYDIWSELRSDIYDFVSDVRNELWEDDIERANREILMFEALTAKKRGINPPELFDPNLVIPDSLSSVATYEELEAYIIVDLNKELEALVTKVETLTANIKTYDDYISNSELIESCYEDILTTANKLCIKNYEYALCYSKIIMATEESNDDKYDVFGNIFGSVYDDGCDVIHRSIYNGILKNLKDVLYEGALDDQPDHVQYSDWSGARSDEYELWSDTRSDVYEDWSDTRSDIYDFISDVRSELWGDDTEKAEEIIEDFEKNLEKLKR